MKNLLIFIVTLILVISIGLFFNNVFAFEVNGIVIEESQWNDVKDYSYFLIQTNYSDKYLYYSNSPIIVGSYCSYGVIGKTTVGSKAVSQNYSTTQMLASNHDIMLSSQVHYQKNWNIPIQLKHGDNFTIYNSSDTVLNSNINLKLNKLSTGIVLVTDENGNFKEQYGFGYSTGLNLSINLAPQTTSNVFIAFMGVDILDSFFILNTYQYNYLDVSNYTPSYKIVGGSTILLEGASIPNTVPYIQSNYTTDIFYKYKENNIDYVKAHHLVANEQFNLLPNKNYLIKFRHDTSTTVSVQSNFTLNNTQERISLLDDDNLLDMIIDNGGSYSENTNVSDNYYQVNRFKDCVITSLKQATALGGVMIDVYLTPSSNSNSILNAYEISQGQTYKYKELQIDGTINQNTYRTGLSPFNGIIVLEENGNGNLSVRIDGKYKEDVDYKIEFVNQYEYDSLIESEYDINNPDVVNIDKGLDNDTKIVKDNLWSSIIGGSAWSGINLDEQNNTSDFNLEMTSISKFINKVTEPLQLFVSPITQLFSGLSEVQGLIIYAIGLSTILLIFGR